MRNKKSIILFPPNWSACVNGPHLALPLLSGAGQGLPDWVVQIWDLNAEYYIQNSIRPSLQEIIQASLAKDYQRLDKLYFAWEDSIQTSTEGKRQGGHFGLLSGYSFPELSRVRHLVDVLDRIKFEGTIFSQYYEKHVIPFLVEESPAVIGITISSSNQIVPSLELLALIRQYIPEAFILVGGNVVTRLRDSKALEAFLSLSDQLILFQGEVAFHNVLQTITDIGVDRAKKQLLKTAGNQLIPCDQWPIPSFNGINFEHIAGLPVLPYVSTRGCYWGRCNFCGVPAGWAANGYGGSSTANFCVEQLQQMVSDTGISRIKFVDESMSHGKVRDLCQVISQSNLQIEWEAYTRLEPEWEDAALLEQARACGLRKLYFGLEQAPSASRVLMNKQDNGDPLRILHACQQAGIAVHLFCMVGYPGTSREDAELTMRFLLDNQHLIDTADLVGFRLDSGTQVLGVRPNMQEAPDWALSLPYESTESGILAPSEVAELESLCQEKLWQEAPRLLHPLYRLVAPWANASVIENVTLSSAEGCMRVSNF